MQIRMPKGSQYTPLLIGVCSKDGVLLCADSRTTFYDGERFERDDTCKKLFQINDNLLFGACGIFGENDRFIEPFVGRNLKHIGVNTATELVNDYLLGEMAVGHGLSDRNYLIAGKTRDGKYCLSLIRYNANEQQIEIEKQIGDDHGFYFLMMPPNGYADEQYWKEKFELILSEEREPISDRVSGYVNELKEISELAGGAVKYISVMG